MLLRCSIRSPSATFAPPQGSIYQRVSPAEGTLAGANSPLVDGTNGFFKQQVVLFLHQSSGDLDQPGRRLHQWQQPCLRHFPSRQPFPGPNQWAGCGSVHLEGPGTAEPESGRVAAADKSTTRGGNEPYYLNEPVSAENVFYIGVNRRIIRRVNSDSSGSALTRPW